MMRKDRIRWMFWVGLLGVLGFSSCSPRLRPRRIVDQVDTVVLPPPDTVYIKPGPPEIPAKLMYGVPPARFERMELPEKELNKTETR